MALIVVRHKHKILTKKRRWAVAVKHKTSRVSQVFWCPISLFFLRAANKLNKPKLEKKPITPAPAPPIPEPMPKIAVKTSPPPSPPKIAEGPSDAAAFEEQLEQIDYPEDENFDENLQVEELLEGLGWYAKLQVSLMKSKKFKDSVSGVFIDKISHELKQSETVVYREFYKEQRDEEFSIDMFGEMNL